MPVAGQYNENSVDFTFKRDDIKIPDMKLYTPKNLGKTVSKQANYYKNAPLDSYDAIWAFNDDVWNNKLYERIIDILNNSSYPKEKITIIFSF